MQPLKETKVYIPTHENLKDGWVNLKDSKKVFISEQTGYFLTKQEMEKLLNDMSDWAKYFDEKIGIKYSHTELAYQKLKAEYINKLLNNE